MILLHSMWYQYQVFKFTSWLLRWRGSSCPPQFRRLSLSALASPSDWYHPSYVGALCSSVPNLKWWGSQFLLSHLKGFSKFHIKPWEFGFLCWVPKKCSCPSSPDWYRSSAFSIWHFWLPQQLYTTHSQMFQKVESDLPAKIWRLVGCTKMISW